LTCRALVSAHPLEAWRTMAAAGGASRHRPGVLSNTATGISLGGGSR
jgi:hypothetical protein